ncbi:MAG TPA: hypothetical protein VLR69_13160 [Thermoanaerobaculia bacterium]|nr:hypothetical protein [Thermoanaerobaculia bacterium]
MTELSLSEIVGRLRTQIELHRRQEAFHAEQEALHRDRRAVHAAELEALTRNLAALEAAAATAVELASRPAPALPAAEPLPELGKRLTLPRMIDRVLGEKAPGHPFGAAELTAEINRRFRNALRRPLSPRLVSIALRRMSAAGKLQDIRKGRPHYEALYSRLP